MRIDHLVVGCRDLYEGDRWLDQLLGMPSAGGGEHVRYGTHNRLWRLDGDRYLELIARKQDASAPETAPFGLADAVMQARLEDRPRLLTWVARVEPGDDDEKVMAACPELAAPVAVQRDEFHWRLAIAANKGLCLGGVSPYLIWWQGMHPCDLLPDVGLSLESLQLRTQHLGDLQALVDCVTTDEPVSVSSGALSVQALIRTQAGSVLLD
ncbi:MAG: VOC family protein [Pseudomonadota bacterium]